MSVRAICWQRYSEALAFKRVSPRRKPLPYIEPGQEEIGFRVSELIRTIRRIRKMPADPLRVNSANCTNCANALRRSLTRGVNVGSSIW